ncbi:MAG: pyruvate kinase alpha/beta domain-containing protein [Candidatus Thorarchaeota archaeon]
MVFHFDKPGDYTDDVFSIVKERLKEGDINQIVVATTTGKTALKAASSFSQAKIIAVTHQAGFRVPGELEVPEETLQEIKNKGVKIVTATHTLAGINRAIRKKHGTWMVSELVAESFRMLGQGTKVCVEIVIMAADAGVISMDSDIIAIAGSGRDADTAWVIKPAHSQNFFDMKLKELLCKPKDL